MSRSFALLTAASVVVMLAAATSASSQMLPEGHYSLAFRAVAAVDAAPLSGAEIQARFIGNTIDGVENGQAYSEFIAPDGTIRGTRRGRAVFRNMARYGQSNLFPLRRERR